MSSNPFFAYLDVGLKAISFSIKHIAFLQYSWFHYLAPKISYRHIENTDKVERTQEEK